MHLRQVYVESNTLFCSIFIYNIEIGTFLDSLNGISCQKQLKYTTRNNKLPSTFEYGFGIIYYFWCGAVFHSEEIRF